MVFALNIYSDSSPQQEAIRVDKLTQNKIEDSVDLEIVLDAALQESNHALEESILFFIQSL